MFWLLGCFLLTTKESELGVQVTFTRRKIIVSLNNHWRGDVENSLYKCVDETVKQIFERENFARQQRTTQHGDGPTADDPKISQEKYRNDKNARNSDSVSNFDN